MALWKHEPIESCLCEPVNTSMEDWEWNRVLPSEQTDDPDIIDVEAIITMDVPELADGTSEEKLLVERVGNDV